MSEPKNLSNQIKSDVFLRQQWISVAAYFKAEATDFDPKKDLNNWLEAEIEYNELQIQSFILRCQEDGGISINSLGSLAAAMGVCNAMQIRDKAQLIREIQKATHHRPCFQTTYQKPCKDAAYKCPWIKECQKLIAIWYR